MNGLKGKKMKYDCIVVGAGLTGLSAARYLANQGKRVLVFERSSRIGGLCKEGYYKGTRFSVFGPHIFHTDDLEVWNFLSDFTDWTYFNSLYYVKSYYGGKLWSVPIDYNEIGDKEWDRKTIENILYEEYSKKMWGDFTWVEMKSRPLKRITQVNRTKFDKRYFTDKYQAFPSNGYDQMFQKMTEIKTISITLNSDFNIDFVDKGTPVIYTGRIDKLLKTEELPFMSMGFEIALNDDFPWSDTYGVITFPQDFDFIRAHSSKVLYKQNTKYDVVVYEYPRRSGPLCYPLIYEDSMCKYQMIKMEVLKKYPNVIPAGRSGEFKHMDMDKAVRSGIDAAEKVLRNE
jgi:UDP-galactopyranose mutase